MGHYTGRSPDEICLDATGAVWYADVATSAACGFAVVEILAAVNDYLAWLLLTRTWVPALDSDGPTQRKVRLHESRRQVAVMGHLVLGAE